MNPGDLTGPAAQLAAELEQWWSETAHEDLMACAPKAIEYGAQDLADMGRAMAQMLGTEGVVSDADMIELACVFYVYGKMSRMIGAIRDGRRASDDTLHDISVYTMMIRRARAVGGWPK